MSDEFDIEAEIASRVGAFEPNEEVAADSEAVHLEALAILIDASLSPAERAEGFAQLLASMLAHLGPDEMHHFHELASERGEYSALIYLTEVAQRS
ncbi:MAG TPA: hypothetical protein VEJ84_22040 [Acidimicrobiales bacterium]|nr:hypothetical protein [Acidimicrobiales bacterium]